MNNGWTGGQYSLFRALLGAYLVLCFAAGASWALQGGAVAAAVALLVGFHDRAAALALWSIWAYLHGDTAPIALGWILLAHAALPPAPYGSWTARGRSDPGGGWQFPPALFAAAWILMAVGYAYDGLTTLASSWNAMGAIELLFAPMALLRPLRPGLWCAMLGMHLVVGPGTGMAVLHLFIFDPAWLAPRARGAPDVVFYDGHCGLCHGAVRFLLAEDGAGAAFVFAPLEGEAFQRLSAAERTGLPDSIVVRTADGRLLVRSAAVLHVLDRLGGAWRVLGWCARLFPRAIRDRAYDGVAAVRHRLFPTPPAACPIVPPTLQTRFVT